MQNQTKKKKKLFGGLLAITARATLSGAQSYAAKNAAGRGQAGDGCTPCAAMAKRAAAAKFVGSGG